MTSFCRIIFRYVLACLLVGSVAVQSKTDASPSLIGGQTPARTLHFPEDRSLGEIRIVNDADGEGRDWRSWSLWFDRELLGPARGQVAIPEGKRAVLIVSPEGWRDLRPLADLEPNALDGIILRGDTTGYSQREAAEPPQSPAPGCLEAVCTLSHLKLLVWESLPVPNEELACLTRLRTLERLSIVGYGKKDPEGLLTDESVTLIGQLSSLKSLGLGSKDNLSDKNFREIANLRSLEYLFVGHPYDPAGLRRLADIPNLREISLCTKDIGDAISVSALASVHGLRSVDLRWAEHSDASALLPLTQLSALEELRLDWVQSEEVIRVLASIKSLRRLYMDLGVDAPLAPLARLPHLQVLDLESRCSDEMLDGIGPSPSLKSFRAMSAGMGHQLRGLTDRGMAHLAKMKTLESLELWDGEFTDAGLEALSGCRKLRRLIIPCNSTFTDQGMVHVAKLRRLEELDLSGESLTLTGIGHIASLKHLRVLKFTNAPLLDNQGLERISALSQLRILNFYSWSSPPGVTISGLNELRSLKHLVGLEAFGVRADGSTLDISALSQLETLKIRQVSDDDLACLEGLKSLKWLEIGGPGLTNKGLSHLRSLPSLRVLKVWPENQVTEEALKALERDMPSLRWERIRSAP